MYPKVELEVSKDRDHSLSPKKEVDASGGANAKCPISFSATTRAKKPGQ